jgi:hypothetical protein
VVERNISALLERRRAEEQAAEHEITRVISLLTELAGRVGVEGARDPELAELAEDVVPERVLDTLEAHQGGTRRER